MGQYLLFNERKEIKKRGHAILRSHYIFLVFLALLLVLYGGEFKYSKGQWSYSFFSVNYSLPSLEVEREVEEEDEKGKKEESEWEVELERGSNDSSPWYLLPDFLTKKQKKPESLGNPRVFWPRSSMAESLIVFYGRWPRRSGPYPGAISKRALFPLSLLLYGMF